jgi:selenocysteine lyase/cysteine desulfurase
LDIRAIRKDFPITERKIYLNHASTGPPSKQTLNALTNMIELWRDEGNCWEVGLQKIAEAKMLFAKLINASISEIAVIPNTSTGVNIVANLFDYNRDHNIVLNDLEFTANFYPWLNKCQLKVLKNKNGIIPIEDYERAIDDNTIVVPVSHVEYGNGFRHDLHALGELVHEHGGYLFVDGIQSVGAIKVDVNRDNIDFMALGCQKWLLGPSSTGFLYIKEELIDKYLPIYQGWLSVENPNDYDIYNFKLARSASRFELGSPNFIGFSGAVEALKMILKLGIEEIEARILNLTDHLIELITERFEQLELQTPLARQYRAGILNVRYRTSTLASSVVDTLAASNIVVSSRMAGVRISPHFYNTEAELDFLVSKLP